MCSPTISRRPSVLAATAIIAATETMRPRRCDRDDATAFALLQVSGVEPQLRPFAGERAVEEGVHALVDLPRLRGGRLLHSLETGDLLMPDSPIACTRSSTRRVDTPPIQASWITATSAFSELLRASRNGGK